MNPTATDVAEFAASLSESFLLCREMGHNWRPYTARWDDEHVVYDRIIRCSRCYTERHQTLSPRGHVLSSGYNYPDGYQSHGLGRLDGESRDQIRLESLLRAIDKPQPTKNRKAS